MDNLYKSFEQLISNDPEDIKNIGTFTAVHDNEMVKKYLELYVRKNLVDKKAYFSLSFFEKEVDKFFKNIFDNKNGKVILTSGSTESILLAFYYARENAKSKKGINNPNIILPEHAHYSLFKCAKLLGIEIKKAKHTRHLTVDVQDVENKIDSSTILVVGVMGSTELGVIDDLRAIDDICQEKGIGLHVDAAIGGFIIPFLETDVPYKFSDLKSMESLNVSAHKFGLSLPGCGVLLIRNKKMVHDYSDNLSYLSSGKRRIENLLITQGSLGVYSLYINILQYGIHGYKEFAKKYLNTKATFINQLEGLDVTCFSGSPYTPQLFLHGKNIKVLSKYLKTKGWTQSVYKAKESNKSGIRIVIKKDQEFLLTNNLTRDIKAFYNRVEQQKDASIQTQRYLVTDK